jgi:hypothetical protein
MDVTHISFDKIKDLCHNENDKGHRVVTIDGKDLYAALAYDRDLRITRPIRNEDLPLFEKPNVKYFLASGDSLAVHFEIKKLIQNGTNL